MEDNVPRSPQKYESMNEVASTQESDASSDAGVDGVTDLRVREDEATTATCSGPQCRNLTGFWFLGLCNNFAYVVMLSAAHDILKTQGLDSGNMTDLEPTEPLNKTKLIPHCNTIGTGAVLLADVLPTFIIKLTAPFFIQSIPYRDVLSTWSSGTGGAGVFGALSYAGLIALGLSPRNTLLLMILIPLLLMVSYFLVLVKPNTIDGDVGESTEALIQTEEEQHKQAMERGKYLTFPEKFKLIQPLLRYMIPLAVVYFAEYFINQGLTELIEFQGIWLTLSDQYRWYAVIYQIGVFISRSSAQIVRIRKIWILAILQVLNIAVLLFQIYYKFVPIIWIVFVFILYEGLLGGAAYVNTFYMISEMVKDHHREYSLGVASLADSSGIVLAGLIAVPVHNYLCQLYV